MKTPIFLQAAEKPADTPAWVTQEYLEECMTDRELQKSWEPKIGDWYFCGDLYKVMQITNLRGYYSQGEMSMSLKTDRGKDSRGHWMCDTYLPEPKPTIASV